MQFGHMLLGLKPLNSKTHLSILRPSQSLYAPKFIYSIPKLKTLRPIACKLKSEAGNHLGVSENTGP